MNTWNSCTDNYDIFNEVLISKGGFLGEEAPLTRLPQRYIHWENTADILPKLISQILDKSSFNKEINYLSARRLLENIPQYELNNLTKNEKRRAILILGIFAHAWIWLPYVSGISDRPEHYIPQQISVPLYQLSTSLNRLPVLTNSDLFDYNWKQSIPGEEISLHNLDILNGFVKNDAEKYFYLTFFMMTLKGVPAIQAILEIQTLLEDMDFISDLKLIIFKKKLNIIIESLEEVRKNLAQVFSKINKEDWFNKVRWFSVGWNSKDMFPKGVTYEGVEAYNNQGKFFYGPSGFQYPIFQCVDAFLGIQHEAYTHQLNSHLYMPHNQVKIINAIKNGPKIRTFLTEQKIGNRKIVINTSTNNYKRVVEAYNSCLQKVKNIRSLHFGVVSKYLTKMMLQDLDNKMILTTGGSQDNHENLLKGIINHHNIKIQ